MSGIITTLGWTRPWSEQLLQAFFVAAKCIWLLHLLAFSFNQPLGILRVDENILFESDYMEDIFSDRQRSQGPGRVKIMVHQSESDPWLPERVTALNPNAFLYYRESLL
ncbi:IRK-interacting protein [Sesamum angolense]|uniref:IRK-interacting protein n=1 Tax=Sesamum angolense TaxID=2727404 RepID=A0AAE1XB75_9LAMI|nr:IRK-interacting protein [Sesamum angolense]